MAYFPNGSSGEVLDMQCCDCLPYDPCPVAWVQLEYNYEQCKEGQEKMRALLNCLVDEKGKCKMKQYVKPRLTETRMKANNSALERKLVFGDREQIDALKGE